jgi:PS-10 peptidase S37
MTKKNTTMRSCFFALTLLFILNVLNAQPSLGYRLFVLPDVIFTETEAPKGFEAAYELRIRQPLDHNDPEKGHFYQRAFLTHKGFDRPMVIAAEGYQRPANRIYELTRLLGANQVDVEHRYFGVSLPDSIDYRYLNLKQTTADLHHINEIFRQIYTEKWVSTGISKGGQTTIYYRYFYPDDVDVSVPYVAPLNLSAEDTRIYAFLDTVGTEECRAAIRDVQVRLLKNRDEVLPLLRWYGKGAGLTFEYLNLEQAFEYAILEYPFSFWQWGHDCATIPGKKATLEETLEHFVEVSGIDFFADKSMQDYASHYYQAGAEMGYYGYRSDDFKGLLKALPTSTHPSAIFMPGKIPVTFDGVLPKKVYDWVNAEGNNFIYIYGDSDTWSSTAVRPSGNTNSVWFFLPGKDHGHARIKNMTAEDKAKLVGTLEEWLGMEVVGE